MQASAPSNTAPTEPVDQNTAMPPADMPPAPGDERAGFSPQSSPVIKSMKRMGSELKIDEMLDLFDTSRTDNTALTAVDEAEWQ